MLCRCLKDRIVTVDSNTFRIKIRDNEFIIFFLCYFFIILFLGSFFPLLLDKSINIFLRIFGSLSILILLIIIEICIFRIDVDDYLKLESNSFSIINKRLCCKPKITVYRYEELKRAAILYLTNYDEGISRFYRLVLVHNSNEKIKVLEMSSRIKEQDLKYFYYLVDIINGHIKNNIQI